MSALYRLACTATTPTSISCSTDAYSVVGSPYGQRADLGLYYRAGANDAIYFAVDTSSGTTEALYELDIVSAP